jgi:hypothetical protein
MFCFHAANTVMLLLSKYPGLQSALWNGFKTVRMALIIFFTRANGKAAAPRRPMGKRRSATGAFFRHAAFGTFVPHDRVVGTSIFL